MNETPLRIDRLARSLADLQAIVAHLRARGAHLAATERPVDTATAAGKAVFEMLGVFAEFETNLWRERQAEGIAASTKAARRRCERAEEMLLTTRLPTSEIAHRCGFANQAHLTGAFRKPFSITPAAARRGSL